MTTTDPRDREVASEEMIDPVSGEIIDQQQLAERLLAQAKEQGVDLVGPDGLLNQLTKNVLETALEAEMDDHLGYERHDPIGRNSGNSRNGTRSKTVLTEIGPVEIDVPRDTDASFDPKIVRKRQRRLDGIDEIVLSLTARGLTTGEIAAHFDEVYGAKVSKETISKITDKVVDQMAEWASRPLDPSIPRASRPIGSTTSTSAIAMVDASASKSNTPPMTASFPEPRSPPTAEA